MFFTYCSCSIQTNKYVVRSIDTDKEMNHRITLERLSNSQIYTVIRTANEYGCQLHFEEGDTLIIKDLNKI